MLNRSLVEMVKGRAREFKREPSALFFVVFMPIIWMLILGLAFSGDTKEIISIGISQNIDRAKVDDQLYKSLDKDPSILVSLDSDANLRTMMKRGEILLILEAGMQASSFVYRFDPNNPQSVRARNILDHNIQEFYGRRDVVQTTIKPLNVRGSRYIDFLIPGLLALSILTSSLFGTGMTIVVNRREKLLKLYLTTPMSPFYYIFSHIIGRFIILATELLAIMLVGWLIFDFNVQGSWLAYIGFSCLGAAAFTGMAIFFGARTANSSTYNGMTNLITLPMMLLSGVWFSRAGFPEWVSQLIDFLPLTALVDGLRKISLEGQGLAELGFEISVLVGYLLVGVVAAKKTFRWY